MKNRPPFLCKRTKSVCLHFQSNEFFSTVKMDKNLGREELEAFEDKIKIRVANRFNVDQADVYLNVNSTPNIQKEEK